MPFGAFVEFLPGREGMVHVSKMAAGYVNRPEDVVKLGDKVKVRVEEIDDLGRINLSMLFGEDAQRAREQRESRPPREGWSGGSHRPSGGRGFGGGMGRMGNRMGGRRDSRPQRPGSRRPYQPTPKPLADWQDDK
ncbi:hypothetical protein A2160_00875 [Candidatus Beckwithbacteria bacterium RBG_13_42_9]|uniref:S1 motif domain-containing protein n=1 Tax=Candidatus Beckwithbacteria bacterium RBG_13_42_9 TaxID=1797457 RepID=A0A1F5E3L5_9BACT|nr:MAG: hypothetical protein A2160_00875 [Candidatus Beckwithbacteria bacterium RBG_13_42_9]